MQTILDTVAKVVLTEKKKKTTTTKFQQRSEKKIETTSCRKISEERTFQKR